MSEVQQLLFCPHHPGAYVSFHCYDCQESLCEKCALHDEGKYYCKYCKTRLTILSEHEKSRSRGEDASAWTEFFETAGSGISNHILIPAAIITMVSALLFFLLDLRSIYASGTGNLKRIGFFFTVATVLITRYGKVYEDQARQKLYTGILAVATVIAMIRDAGKGFDVVFYLGIIYLIWRFASSLTNSVHLVDLPRQEEFRMYGLERLEYERALKQSDLAKSRKKQVSPPQKDTLGNPAGRVAQLACIALLLFGLGEPILLKGGPELARRGFFTIVIFLLATAVVMAAGSASGTYRYTIKKEGKASLGVIPKRIGLTILVMLVVLPTLLFVVGPDVIGQGKGNWQPVQKGTGQLTGEGGKETGGAGREQTSSGEKKTSSKNVLDKLLGFFQKLGRMLLIPVLIIVGVMGIVILIRLLPTLKKINLKGKLKTWLANLQKFFKSSRKKKALATPKIDPTHLLAQIPRLPPRDGVILAYTCLLLFLERLGIKPNVRLTPYELLYSIPSPISAISSPARVVTELYIQAAFSPLKIETTLRDQALNALESISHFAESQSKG